MKRSFETTFRRSVNSGHAALHEWAEAGRIRGFVLAYLGQQDAGLPYLIPDLVRHDQVASPYPTDFSPMPAVDMELLRRRGEQFSRLLISRYVPEL